MDKLTSIRSSIEKILKALIVKLENGDEISVSRELIWYDNLIEKIYDLKKKNAALFLELVDPDRKFKHLDPFDYSMIDFTKVKLKEGSKRSKKSYSMTVIEAEYDLLDTLFSFGFRLWEAGIRHDRFEVSKRALYTLGNLYGIVANSADPKKQFNYALYFNYFCNKLNARLASILSKESSIKENFSLISHLVTHFHLDHLSSESLPKDKIEVLASSIFTSLKLCVDYDQEKFIDNFVRSASHRNLLPLWPSEISQLDRFISDKLGKEDFESVLSKTVNDVSFEQTRAVFTQKEYIEVSDNLRSLRNQIEKIVGPLSIEDVDLLNRCISTIDDHVFKRYKYKLTQRVLSNALIYCIFKEKFDTINFAFQFHSPSDSDAVWSNDDIIFHDLFDILRLISLRWEIQNDLIYYWPDHHGSPLYIDIYFIGLLNRWAKNNYHNRQNHLAIATQRIIIFERRHGRDNLISWTREIEDLKVIAQRRYMTKKWPFNEPSQDEYQKLLEILNFIIDEFFQATT